MKASSFKNAALFMALAVTALPLTAAPALAGVSHGGSPLASTDEHASLAVGESATADKTVEQPVVKPVNIQPSMRDGDTVKANADANTKLTATTTDAKAGASVDNGGAAVAPGATPNTGGRVKLQSGAKDGSAK